MIGQTYVFQHGLVHRAVWYDDLCVFVGTYHSITQGDIDHIALIFTIVDLYKVTDFKWLKGGDQQSVYKITHGFLSCKT